jgi:hypothetical protein
MQSRVKGIVATGRTNLFVRRSRPHSGRAAHRRWRQSRSISSSLGVEDPEPVLRRASKAALEDISAEHERLTTLARRAEQSLLAFMLDQAKLEAKRELQRFN